MNTYTITTTNILPHVGHSDTYISFGVPEDFDRRRRNDHKSFYCPTGHSQNYYGPSEATKQKQLREQAELESQRMRDRLVRETRNRQATERQLSAQKGVTTKLKKRVMNGVCPCCNRSFENVSRHMKTMHPNEVAA